MELNVNIVPQSYLPEIRVSKNDNTMRTIKINLIDENRDPWTPPAGASAVFTGTKPSGLGFTLPCTISGSAVTFVMLTTACNEDGRFLAEVRFTDGSGGRIGSCNVMMNVEWDPHSDDTTDGDEEELINEITALLEQITEQADRADEAAEKAEQAAASAGYMFFYIDDNGHLIYQRTSNTEVDFYLQNGHLFVEAAA